MNDVLSNDLVNVLRNFDYKKLVDFCSLRNVFRPMALKLIEELHLTIHDDTNAICYYLPKDDSMKFKVTLPHNVQLKPLNESHANKVNAAWPHRYDGSIQFILYSIKYHINFGLFNDGDELLAWGLRYDNGLLGLIQVDESQMRKGYGSLITKALSKKIAEEFNSDISALIKRDNVSSMNMFTKLGFKPAERHSWFVLRTQ